MEDLILHIESIDIDKRRAFDGYSFGGIMYVTIGEHTFPGRQWYDMVFSNLKAWAPALISFGQDHTDFCVLSFMDGPCEIKLDRQSDGAIQACCYRNNKVETQKTNINFAAFLESVIKCVRKYDRLLYENNLPAQFQSEQSMLRNIARSHDGSISRAGRRGHDPALQ